MPQTIPDWATETETPDWAQDTTPDWAQDTTPDWAREVTLVDPNADRAQRISTTTGSTAGQGLGPGGSILESIKKEPTPDWSGTVASAVFPESEPEQSLVGLDPANVPAGESAPGRVVRSVERTALGLGQFMTSPKGIVQQVTALTPARLLVMAGWAHDMAAGAGQSAGNLSTLISKPDKTPEDWQQISDDTVNTVVSLAAAGKLGSDVGAGVTGIRAPITRFIEPKTKRLSKDLAVAIDKAPLQMPGSLPVPGISQPVPDWAADRQAPGVLVDEGNFPLGKGFQTPEGQAVTVDPNAPVQTPGAVNEPAADAAQFPLGKGFQTPEGQAVTVDPNAPPSVLPDAAASLEATRTATPEPVATADAAQPAIAPATSSNIGSRVQAPSEPVIETPPVVEPSPPAAATAPAAPAASTKLIPVEVTPEHIAAMASTTERSPDVLDDVQQVTSAPVRFNPQQHGNLVADARQSTLNTAGRPSAATKRLDKFMSDTTGEPVDKVLQGLAAQNPKYADWTEDDLGNAIVAAHQLRENPPIDLNARQLAETRARDNLFNQANRATRVGSMPVPIEQLQAGDTFTINGHRMSVPEDVDQAFPVDADTGKISGVTIEGAYGRQHIPVGQSVHVDNGSLKEAGAAPLGVRLGMGAAEGGDFINSTAVPIATAAKPPEITGMGGAVPKEFEGMVAEPTGIKKAAVATERKARGEAQLEPPEVRSFPKQVWQETLAKVQDDPEAPLNLVNSLLNDQVQGVKRTLTDDDVAMLLHRHTELTYDRAKLVREQAMTEDDAKQFPNRSEELPRIKADIAKVDDQLDVLERAIAPAATETARGLAALRAMVQDNYSLTRMERVRTREVEAAQGHPLTSDQHTAMMKELLDTRAKLKDAEEREARAKALEDEARSKALADEAVKASIAEMEKRPGYDRQVQSLADRIVSALETEATAARARLKAAFAGKGTAGIVPKSVLADLATVGAAHIARGTLDFARWSKAMVDDFGDQIVPWLNQAWEKANGRVNEAVDRLAKGKQSIAVRQRVRKEDISGQRENIIRGLKNASNQKRPLDEQGDYIRKLMENFIASGVKEREPLVDAIHKVLTEEIGLADVSRRDVREAMAGYGRFKALNPDEIKATRRDLSHQIAQTLKLEDILAKRPLPKSGVEHHTPSTEGRLLQQQVNEAKRRYGVVTTDPAKQLKSALAARKTWLNNRLADLQFQIDAGKRSVPTKSPPAWDAEVELLKTKVADLRAQLDALDPKPGITDAQRAAIAEQGIERQIDLLQKQISGQESLMPSRRTPVSSARLDALKAQRDALTAQRDELRETNAAWQKQQAEAALERQKTSLENSIAEKEKQLAAGPQPPVGRAMNRPLDPLLEQLAQQRDALNRQLAEARRKPNQQKYAEQLQRALETMQRQIAERQAKLAAGDLSTGRAPRMNRPMSPELEIARQQLDLVNRQLAEARNGPKLSPEEIAIKSYLARLKSSASTYADRLARGDFAPKQVRPAAWKQSPELIQAFRDKEAAKDAFREGLDRAKRAARSGPAKVVDVLLAAIRAPFAIAIAYHGTVGMETHAGARMFLPSMWSTYWPHFFKQWPMWLNKDFHARAMYKLVNDPEYYDWLKAGADIDPRRKYTDTELYASWGKRFLGSAASQRGFDTLKIYRMAANQAMWRKVDPAIKANPEAAAVMRQNIAKLNNHGTGVANIGHGPLTTTAQMVMFAAKLEASRWARVLGDPVRTAYTFADWRRASVPDRAIAVMRLKHAAEFAAFYYTALLANQGMLAALGSNQRVNLSDPRKSDWLKFKAFGYNIMLDGGLLQPIRFIGQMVLTDMLGHRTDYQQLQGTRFGQTVDRAGRYARGKMSPQVGLAVDSAFGADYTGRPMPFSSEKPRFPDQHKYTVGEYLWSKGPIPATGAAEVIYDALHKQGMKGLQAQTFVKAATVAAAESMGMHASPEYQPLTPAQAAGVTLEMKLLHLPKGTPADVRAGIKGQIETGMKSQSQ